MDPRLVPLEEEFNSKCAKAGIKLSSGESEQLLQYLSALLKWNKAFNLTAITDPQQALDLHLLDSVAVSPQIKNYASLLDVGTGGGLPGIPLAILNPEKQFTLLDTNSKKTRFLKQVVYELSLNNVQVVNKRVQDFESQSGYACILSRAFASLIDMVGWTEHLLAKDGHWLAMKGQYPQQELADLMQAFDNKVELLNADEVRIPAIKGEQTLYLFEQKTVIKSRKIIFRGYQWRNI